MDPEFDADPQGDPDDDPALPEPLRRPRMTPDWHAEAPWYLGLGAAVAAVMWWQLAGDGQSLWVWALAGAVGGLLLAWLREILPYWLMRLLDRRR